MLNKIKYIVEIYDGVYVDTKRGLDNLILDVNKGWKENILYVEGYSVELDNLKVMYEDATCVIFDYSIDYYIQGHWVLHIGCIAINKVTKDVGIFDSSDISIWDWSDYIDLMYNLRNFTKGLSLSAKEYLCKYILYKNERKVSNTELVGITHCGLSVLLNFDLLKIKKIKRVKD